MNPYTYKVSEKRISFSAEFKKKFWDMHSKGQLPRNIVKQLGKGSTLLKILCKVNSVGFSCRQTATPLFRA